MTKKTYYHIILDQSGSMHDCISQTITGFNKQLQILQSLQEQYPDQEILVGLTRFNNAVLHTYSAQKPFTIKKLNNRLYVPSGGTALYDAIGQSVSKLQEDIQPEIDGGIATAVVIILTDGHENSSRVFTHEDIASLIENLEQTGKWTFSYLGATIDAVQVARELNIRDENSMHFSKSKMPETFIILEESMRWKEEQTSKGIESQDFLEPKK